MVAKLMTIVRSGYDPASTNQTQRLVGCMQRNLQDFPSTTPKWAHIAKNLQAILQFKSKLSFFKSVNFPFLINVSERVAAVCGRLNQRVARQWHVSFSHHIKLFYFHQEIHVKWIIPNSITGAPLDSDDKARCYSNDGFCQYDEFQLTHSRDPSSFPGHLLVLLSS